MPYLIEQLGCEDGRVFLASIEALGHIGPEASDALPRLVERMPRAPTGRRRRCGSSPPYQTPILEAVEQIGPDVEHAFPLLLGVLESYNYHLIEAATSMLEKFDPDVVGDRVLHALSAMGDFVGYGVSVIRSYGDKAVPLILSALEDADDPDHRHAGLLVLENDGGREGTLRGGHGSGGADLGGSVGGGRRVSGEPNPPHLEGFWQRSPSRRGRVATAASTRDPEPIATACWPCCGSSATRKSASSRTSNNG